MSKYGIIGERQFINPLIDDIITNPHGNTTHPWLHYEPKTGRPHGETPTICTNLALNWLRENYKRCEFIIYLIPPCGVGGNYYKCPVISDEDFIEPHIDIRELYQHSKYIPGKQMEYFGYIRYLLEQFPNLYLLPYQSFIGEGDYVVDQLLIQHPTRVVDPKIFIEPERNKLNVIRETIFSNKKEIKEVFFQLRRTLTQQHRNVFCSTLGIEYDPVGPKSNIRFATEAAITFCYFDRHFLQLALRHFISLRTLGGYNGKIIALLENGKWEEWELQVLEKLGVTYYILKREPKYHVMIQRFVDIIQVLKELSLENIRGPLIHFDADVWFQRKIEPIIQNMSRQICFGMWHAHDILLKSRYEQYQQKYLKIVSETARRDDQRKGEVVPKGGMPHGGFHGGPIKQMLERYVQMEQHLKDEIIENKRTNDEISLFISCDPRRDRFDLHKFWTSNPRTIDLVTKEIKDENGEVKPVIHFENTQKTSSLADFFVIFPDVVSRAIDQYDLFELTEAGRITAWHL